jgi:hypothetical protein
VKKFSLAIIVALLMALAATASLAELAAQTETGQTPAQLYPQIDISGYKKWESKQVSIDDMRNYFTAISQLGYSPNLTGGPWQERLQLRIVGQLSENLSVGYDLEQQPETPEKYDVRVKYDNNELTFGDINANFSGNEFLATSKFLNGVMLTAKDGWYDIVAVPSAKLKSQTQALTSQNGNNTKGPYNLGHGSIIDGSEQVQLNSVFLKKNIDYTIDYFEGKITFNRMLSATDVFQYSYEYTDILDLFFPTLSKRDFLGFQSRFSLDPDKFGRPEPKEVPQVGSARDVFPSRGTVEPEVLEAEASGRYLLQHAPVTMFSEALTFMGTRLKKNEDYVIRYNTGEIKLLTRFLPSSEEALTVEYKYSATTLESEVLPGIASFGPYRLKRKNLVSNSERIEVDGKLFVRDLDYTIKYNVGELMFSRAIGQTSQIKAVYQYNLMALPPEITPRYPKELKLGLTYLNESAKPSAGAPTTTAIESYTGQNILSNNNIINLQNRPITTAEAAFIVKINGIVLTPEVDYTIPTTEVDPATGFVRVAYGAKLGYINDRTDPADGYTTGTVYFIKPQNIQPADDVTITYTYSKGIAGQYSGVGDGSRNPYYLRNTRNIIPGTETVQVWEQGSSDIKIYSRNASFDAQAGETGYSIKYDPNNPAITFNTALGTTKSFKIIFQYVPPAGNTGGNITQSAIGFDGSFKIGDIFKVDSAYAQSDSDQLYVAEPTIEAFFGNGTKTYALHSTADIIEASEKITVNNRVLNKDIDYFISYTKPGQFNFYYITPTSQDAISVDYSFQSQSGIPVGLTKKVDSAFRLGAETKLFGDALTVNGTTKKIGFDFSPLGGTAIGVGSNYEEYNLALKPPASSFYSNYSYKFNQNPLGASRQNFLRTYDHNLALGLAAGNLGKLDLTGRLYTSLDDPLAGTTLHNSDNEQSAYGASFISNEFRRGQLSLNFKGDVRKTISKTNTLDDQGTNESVQKTNFIHTGADARLTDRLSLGYDWQYNEPITQATKETITIAHTKALDAAYNLNLDLTALFLQKWTARISLLNHDDYFVVPTGETVSTRNETYHTDITPFPMLTASADHNQQERTSYVAGQQNPRTTRTTGNARLSPFPWFSTGVNYTKGETIPETGTANATRNRTYGGDVDWVPISFNFIKLASRFVASTGYQIAPSGVETVKTDTRSVAQNYALTLSPVPIMPVTLGLAREDYQNYNNSLISPVSTESQNETATAAVTLSVPMLPALTLSSDWNQKITRDLKSGASRPKTVTNAHAAYQIFTWGTVAYDLSEERNQGEVQAGVIVPLDLKKVTGTLSLNIKVPINNPVLSNFNLLFSLKTVQYENYLSAADNFKATLLSFEGTMNF